MSQGDDGAPERPPARRSGRQRHGQSPRCRTWRRRGRLLSAPPRRRHLLRLRRPSRIRSSHGNPAAISTSAGLRRKTPRRSPSRLPSPMRDRTIRERLQPRHPRSRRRSLRATRYAQPVKRESVDDSESTPASPPFQRRSRAKVLSFVLLAALLVGGGGFAYQARATARSASVQRAAPQTSVEATVEPPSLATLPAPPPTYTAEPPPSASAGKKKPAANADGAGAPGSVSADPSTQGILDTTQLPPGRKIVVDGRMVGTSPRKVAVRCGVHRIVIGDLPPESIEFPCGGEVTFSD